MANISTPPTPSVTAWLRCSISAARPSASPSTSVTVHSGREMSSGDCSCDLGEVEHLAHRAGLGHAHAPDVEVEVEVGVDHPARRGRRQRRHHDLLAKPQHLARRVLEHGVRNRLQSGVVSRISRVMIPERVRGLASPRCSNMSNALSSSGRPAASTALTTVSLTSPVTASGDNASPLNNRAGGIVDGTTGALFGARVGVDRPDRNLQPAFLGAQAGRATGRGPRRWFGGRTGVRTLAGAGFSASLVAGFPLRSAGNCARQLAKCGSIQHSCLLAIPAGRNSEGDRCAMCVGPDVIAQVGLRAVDANRIDRALVSRCHVGPVAVRPCGPELHGDGARAC